MNFDFHPGLAAFRTEVRAFIRESLPGEECERFRRGMPIDRPTMAAWHAKRVEKGWAARGGPNEHGGAGFSPEQQYVFNQDLASEGAPFGHARTDGTPAPPGTGACGLPRNHEMRTRGVAPAVPADPRDAGRSIRAQTAVENAAARTRIYSRAAGKRESGGTGRRAGFRCQWGNPWGFDSPLSHHRRAGRVAGPALCVLRPASCLLPPLACAKESALKDRPRLVVGISGASGVIYGIRLLELLRELPVETHLVMSKAAEMTIAYETDRKPAEVRRLATVCHPVGDIGASISSGSFRTLGMLVAPCSVRTMSEIATGVTASLLTRAADVTLKERRRLVLLLRETPLHTGHVRTMLALSEAGGIIMPPVPAFYAELRSIDEMIDQTLGRALDLFGIDAGITKRWGEDVGGAPADRK